MAKDLGVRICPRPECDGSVRIYADNLAFIEESAEGWCNECGQHYEVELIIEAEMDLTPID